LFRLDLNWMDGMWLLQVVFNHTMELKKNQRARNYMKLSSCKTVFPPYVILWWSLLLFSYQRAKNYMKLSSCNSAFPPYGILWWSLLLFSYRRETSLNILTWTKLTHKKRDIGSKLNYYEYVVWVWIFDWIDFHCTDWRLVEFSVVEWKGNQCMEFIQLH